MEIRRGETRKLKDVMLVSYPSKLYERESLFVESCAFIYLNMKACAKMVRLSFERSNVLLHEGKMDGMK